MKSSFHTGFLSDYSATEAVRVIRDHGYEEVELNAESLPWAEPHVGPETPPAVRRELAQLGPFSALSAHHADFGSPDPDARTAAVKWTGELLRLAVDLEIEFVHVIPGGSGTLEGLHAALGESLEQAADHGLVLGLEPIVNQAVAGRENLEGVLQQHPDLRVNFDPSHLQVTDGDVVESARRFAALIEHVAIKDATGTADDWAFVALGTGQVDFAGMVGTLVDAGYDGTLSVEHESHVFGGDQRGTEQVLTESRKFVEGLIRSVHGAR